MVEKKIIKNTQSSQSSRPKFWLEGLKSAVIFAAMAGLIMITFKLSETIRFFSPSRLQGRVLGISEQAAQDIKSAGRAAASLSFADASRNFQAAEKNFSEARSQVGIFASLLAPLARNIPIEQARLAGMAPVILEMGEESSALGQDLAAAAALIFEIANPRLRSAGPLVPAPSLTAALEPLQKAANRAVKIRQLAENLDPAQLPAEYADKARLAKTAATQLSEIMSELGASAEAIIELAGGHGLKRYLVVFQNNTEMRGGGGFIGSYALVNIDNGQIKQIETTGGGSYDTEAGMKEFISAPEPLRLLRNRWFFWDANWWPDWPATAAKLAWFFEHSGGPTVDGVFAITPDAFAKILSVFGPVELPAPYNTAVSADSFYDIIQTYSEQKPDVTAKPKQIIGDLLEAIRAEAPKRINPQMAAQIAGAMEESFAEKQAMAWSRNENVQALFAKYGWDCRIEDAPQDYLQIADTNIGGGKSDPAIEQNVTHEAKISKDGTVTVQLAITRTHTGRRDEGWTGVHNVDWMRIYVPKGSRLISARGFEAPWPELFKRTEDYFRDDPLVAQTLGLASLHEPSGTKIFSESGKTVFANWIQTDPGETAAVFLEYQLPLIISGWRKEEAPVNPLNFWDIRSQPSDQASYQLMIEKQPGAKRINLNSIIKIDGEPEILWSGPVKHTQNNNSYSAHIDSREDVYIGVIFQFP